MSHSTMAAAVPASRSRIQVPLEEAAHLGVAPLPPAPASSLATAATATASAAAAASSSAAAAAHEDTEAEAQAVFAECCQALNLDSDTRSEAWDMWARARTYLCSDDLGDLRPWFCCTIYLASHHAFQSSRSGRGAHVAFSGLISCCKLTPHEFYLQLSDFALRANLDELLRMQDANGRGVRSHAEHRIKQLDVSVVMARHYQHMFDALFPPLHAGPSAVLLKELHPFAWSLFLLCKNRLAKISADALPSFLLLVSVLRFCYVNARRASTLAALAIEPPEDICLYLCRRVCNEDRDAEELAAAANVFVYQTWDALLVTLTEKSMLNLNRNFTGLFAAEANEERPRELSAVAPKDMTTAFSQNLRSIKQRYDTMLLVDCLPDERRLIEGGQPSFPIQASTPGSEPTRLHAYRRRKMLESPSRSASRLMTSHANSATLLRSLSAGTAGERAIPRSLRALLQDVLPADATAAAERVLLERAQRAHGLLLGALHDLPGAGETHEQRLAMVFGLYFRVLESVLRRDAPAGTSPARVDALLQHDDFQLGLVAICTEVTLFSFKVGSCSFPWVLLALELDPLAFQSGVEVVVRAEAGLSGVLIKHLSRCENECLARLAWRADARLGTAALRRVGDATPLDPALVLASPALAPALPALGAEVAFFTRKLLALAATRLDDLRLRLNMPPAAAQGASALFRHCLDHLAGALLVNRHLDRVMLCAVFAVLRLRQETATTFRTILTKYKEQSQATPLAYLEPSILEYYNDVFLPAVETHVVPLSASLDAMPPPHPPLPTLSPAASLGTTPTSHAPRRLAPHLNVTVRFKPPPSVSLHFRPFSLEGEGMPSSSHPVDEDVMEVKLFSSNGRSSRATLAAINRAVASGLTEGAPVTKRSRLGSGGTAAAAAAGGEAMAEDDEDDDEDDDVEDSDDEDADF